MDIKPFTPRHTLTESRAGLEVRIPARRNWFHVLFTCFWLCIWVVGEVAETTKLVTSPPRQLFPQIFLPVWLCGWTIGGGAVIYGLLWQLVGRDIVTVAPLTLHVRWELLGFGRTKQYDLSEVRHLRYAAYPSRNRMSDCGYPTGRLAFEYGAQTICFGKDLDEAEAQVILPTLSARIPLANQPAVP